MNIRKLSDFGNCTRCGSTHKNFSFSSEKTEKSVKYIVKCEICSREIYIGWDKIVSE